MDTSPLGVRRQQTRPLPVAGGQPPGDDSATAARPVPVPPAAAPHDATAAGATVPGASVPGGTGPGLEARPPKVTVTRVAASRNRELGGSAVRRVRAAGRADGAEESGLSGLVWVNALHVAGDALIAVSLAGTLFFAAASEAQRGNVALYLLVTMAPFAVVAPRLAPRHRQRTGLLPAHPHR